MSPEKEKALAEKYPRIFKFLHDENASPRWSIVYGIECGDGWYDIVDVLCSNIQSYVDRYNESLKDFAKEGTEPLFVEAHQVKQKFAGLRFYTNEVHDEISGMIRVAESMSYRICENCGNKGGRKSTGGWIFTKCDPCWEEFEKKRTGK